MDPNTVSMIINIVLGVLTVAGTCASYYFSIKSKLMKAAIDSIDENEVEGVAGIDKFNDVCDQLMNLIPAVAKPFITRAMVETVVQHAFDGMERYAEKQVAKENSTKENNPTTDLKDEVINSDDESEEATCTEECYSDWSSFGSGGSKE